MSKFTESDFPMLHELLLLEMTITLDCEDTPEENSYPDEYAIPLSIPGVSEEADVWGNFFDSHVRNPSYAWLEPGEKDDAEKKLAKIFKTFVQPDGEIGLTFTYLPGLPWGCDEEELRVNAKLIFDATRLREVMSFEEFLQELDESAPWTQQLFGEGGGVYALIFEVTKAGAKPVLEDFGDEILEKPLFFKRKGQLYNLYISEYSD